MSLELSASELIRYAAHIAVPEIGVEGQERLRAARVLCVGAGGLGSPVLMYLAAAGIGTLGIVDDDRVSESNLQRQIVHGQSRVDDLKADSAADRLREINPSVALELHRVRLTVESAAEILPRYDLIVDGSDNFATRYLVSNWCERLAIPHIWGAVMQLSGQVSVFWAPHGPTYRDLFPAEHGSDVEAPCSRMGVVGALCGVIGSIQALEAVKVITGAGEPLVGRVLLCDGLTMTWRELALNPDPQRPRLGENDPIRDSASLRTTVMLPTLTALELRDRLASQEPLHLLDVREPHEHALVAIPGSMLLSSGDFVAAVERAMAGETLAELPRDKQVIVYCRSGVRSAEALRLLHRAGYDNAIHLEGGVLAWVKDVDPSLPTY